jgi:hypothetical protein
MSKIFPTSNRTIQFRKRTYGANRALLESMKVGDRVFFPMAAPTQVTNRYYNTAIKLGHRYTFRKVDNGVEMTRIA